jgi:Bacterial Ig-like domain (group 3)/FG-GAP-like repeat
LLPGFLARENAGEKSYGWYTRERLHSGNSSFASDFNAREKAWEKRKTSMILDSIRNLNRTAILTRLSLGVALLPVFTFAGLETTAYASAGTATTLELTSGGSPATSVEPGTPVTLTATVVSGGTPVTPGTVTFCHVSTIKTCGGLAVVGTAQLTAVGKASIVVRLGPGSHSLEAVFAGTNTYASSASTPSELTVSGQLTWGTALTFANSANPTMSGLQPGVVATGDFNNDGNPDIAVASTSNLNQPVIDATDNSFAVFLGNGDGTFQAGVSYSVGQAPRGLVAADLNNDGKLDMVTVNLLSDDLSILLGNGDGTFQTPQLIHVWDLTGAVAAADMNGDGNLDLLVATDGGGYSEVQILLANGDGTFQAPIASVINVPGTPLVPKALSIGDFNGDGKPDVAVANWGYKNTETLVIMLGNGDGALRFSQEPAPYTIIQPASSIAAGDFNGDGKLDLAVTYDWSGYTGPGQSSYAVFLGNGDGTFRDPMDSQLATDTTPTSIQVADFNGDGILDLAMLGFGKPMILPGNGDGTFQAPQSFPFGESALAVGDFNGDGVPDLAGPAVLLNTSASGVAASFAVGVSPSSLNLASGKQGTVTVTVTPQNGFKAAVSFACSGLPAGASCAFNPSTVTPSGSAVTTTLTITAQTSTSMLRRHPDWILERAVLVLVFGIVGIRRKRGGPLAILVVSLVGLSLLSACGSSGSHHQSSSTVTVTATSGSIEQTVSIAVTVN